MKDLQDVIEDYAQKVVDDMDIDDLMEAVKDTIIERLNTVAEDDESSVVTEIEESAYADEVLHDYIPPY